MTDPLIGRVFDGTYRIERLLARGGMGAIYVAEHARLTNKRYAIKMLHAMFAADDNVFQRFRREAEIASQLGHEHIVEVHDFNVTQPDRVAYMVMEYLEGEDLSARITKGPLRLGEVVRIVSQVASALTAAHAAGIVHRDLKPQNIFIVRRGGADFVKILDFGISKVRDSSSLVTATQSVMGTPFYMSPEQAMGRVRDVDPRTDVFALGAIIFEMLTGQMAFASDTIPGALYKVVHEQPRPVHELRSELPPVVTDILSCALAKEREQRTPSVQELAAQLARAVTPSMASIAIAATAMPMTGGHTAMPMPPISSRNTPMPMPPISSRNTPMPMPPISSRNTPMAMMGEPSMRNTPMAMMGERPMRNTPTTMSSSMGQVATAHPPKRRASLFVALAGLLIAAAIATVVVVRRQPATSMSPSPSRSPSPAPSPAPAPSPPTPEPEPEIQIEEPPVVEQQPVKKPPRRNRRDASRLPPPKPATSTSRLPPPKPAFGTAEHGEPATSNLPPPSRFEPPPPAPSQPSQPAPARKKSGTIFDQ